MGKYCDPDFVAYTSREMQEALDMTREEMDIAAHQLLIAEQQSKSSEVINSTGGSPNHPISPRLTDSPFKKQGNKNTIL